MDELPAEFKPYVGLVFILAGGLMLAHLIADLQSYDPNDRLFFMGGGVFLTLGCAMVLEHFVHRWILNGILLLGGTQFFGAMILLPQVELFPKFPLPLWIVLPLGMSAALAYGWLSTHTNLLEWLEYRARRIRGEEQDPDESFADVVSGQEGISSAGAGATEKIGAGRMGNAQPLSSVQEHARSPDT